MPYKDLGDVTLFYTDQGQGSPVVLVHGWSCDGTDWSWQIPALVSNHRVITVDLRGHGHSSAPEGGYTPRGFANDIARLLKDLDVPPAVVVGHSLGGAIACALAVEHPERVRAVVPVDPAYGFDPGMRPGFEQLVVGMKGPGGHDVALGFAAQSFYVPATPPALPVFHARRIAALPQHVMWQTLGNLAFAPDQFGMKPDSEKYLRRIAVPALSFRAGRQDPAAVAAWERAQFKHPYSKAVAWEGTGHWLHQERPAEFNSILTEWIAALP
jgi:pimeloyl-ACP methyl ester carboxylesterase